MSSKLEWTCEEYFKQLFGLNPLITDVIPPSKIRHFSDDQQADENALVIQAVQGERRLDGARGAFDVELHAKIRSFSLTSDQNEILSDAIVDSVYNPDQVGNPILLAIRGQLDYLLILDEMTGERTNTKQHRIREKIFPLIAKGNPVLSRNLPMLIYNYTITSLREESTSLEAVLTSSFGIRTLIIVAINDSVSFWLVLEGSADPDDPDGQVQPLDHDDDSNNVYLAKAGGL